MKGSRALKLTLAMTVGVVALLIALRGPSARLAAEHWRKQLDSVPDRRAADLLARVGELGRPGIPVLVEALGSQRESVARAAKDLLCEKLNHWQTQRENRSARNQAELAAALATRAGQFGPTARADAVYLATQILTWLPNSGAIDRSRVIGSCEDVFRAVRDAGGLPGHDGSTAVVAIHNTAEPVRYRPPSPDADAEPDLTVAQWSALPGGGLPIDLLAATEPLHARPNAMRLADARKPSRGNANPTREDNPLRHAGAAADEAGGVGGSGVSSVQRPQKGPALAAPHPPLARKYGPPSGEPDELTSWETVDVMQQLQAADRSAVQQAEAELVRRGFTPVHLELARRLFDPDPAVRRQLTRMLPGLQSADAAPWLLQLALDADNDVRLTAITLMVTTGDPALLDRAEAIARRDSDPRIRRQAQLISLQRGGGR